MTRMTLEFQDGCVKEIPAVAGILIVGDLEQEHRQIHVDAARAALKAAHQIRRLKPGARRKIHEADRYLDHGDYDAALNKLREARDEGLGQTTEAYVNHAAQIIVDHC